MRHQRGAFKFRGFSLYSATMIIFWAILVSVSVILGVGIWMLGILYLGKKLNLASYKKNKSDIEKTEIASTAPAQVAPKIPVLNQTRLGYEKPLKDDSELVLTPILTIQDKTSLILIPIQGKFIQNKSASILADHDGLVYFSLN